MSDPTPKPCPFCGGEKITIVEEFTTPHRTLYCQCETCLACGPRTSVPPVYAVYARGDCIGGWNLRKLESEKVKR